MNNEFISVKDFLQGKKNIHFNDSTQPNKKEKTKKTLPKLYTSIESGIYKGKNCFYLVFKPQEALKVS